MQASGPAAQNDSPTGPALGLIMVIAIVIAGLWSVDLFLARTERDALQSDAGDLYKQGETLLQQGRARDAIDPLRRANSMVRNNRAYQLAYVTALVAAGRLDDAEANLKTLLQVDPNNGPANL